MESCHGGNNSKEKTCRFVYHMEKFNPGFEARVLKTFTFSACLMIGCRLFQKAVPEASNVTLIGI